jgi:signal transduction histidine kinase
VFLALSAQVAIWLDPSELISSSSLPQWLLRVYIAHSVVVMLLVRWRRESTPGFLLLVHAADVVWPALISIYAPGQRSPIFLFFVFVLLAAAYRWGLWETLATALGTIALLCLEGFLLRHVFRPPPEVLTDFVSARLVMRSISLMITALFLGYLAEQQKQLRAEKSAVTRILGRARVESGLTGTLQEILGEMVTMFGAKSSLLASQEANSFRVFVGSVAASNGAGVKLTWHNPSPADRDVYLSDSVPDAFYAIRKGSDPQHVSLVALDDKGVEQRDVAGNFVENLAAQHDFRSVASAYFILGREWWGRIFLFDPVVTGNRPDELRFLQEIVRQVGPAIYNVYLLRRLRLRAGAVERARVARELHDGAVQSLIAMEMEVDVVRRQSAGESERVSSELGRIQGLLREEVLKLRELMQEMKSIDVDSRKLRSFLADTVERFQRETGITARFLFEVEARDMPPRVCREIVRIIQEALVNVRKHSKARQVLVRLFPSNGQWRLTVEDDGRGFDFSGRFSQTELDEARRGPVVIKERVRLIDGELTVESTPGQGSRLEITIPSPPESNYG